MKKSVPHTVGNFRIPGQAGRLLRDRGPRVHLDTSAFQALGGISEVADVSPDRFLDSRIRPELAGQSRGSSEVGKPLVIPGGRSETVRTPGEVIAGLPIPADHARVLETKVREWVHEGDILSFRKELFRGLRALAPKDYQLRSELAKRAMSLYRSTTRYDRRPGHEGEVIQKSSTKGPHKYIDKYEKNGRTVYVYEREGKEVHRYHEDDVAEILERIGEELTAIQAGNPYELDSAGLSRFDMGQWRQVRGTLEGMRHVLAKYKRQIGADEHEMLGLGDYLRKRKTATVEITPKYHPRFGSLQLPMEGRLPKSRFDQVVEVSRWLKKEAGARWDPQSRVWFVPADRLEGLPKVWLEYQERMADAGVAVGALPELPKAGDPKAGVPVVQEVTADEVIERLRTGIRGREVPKTIAVKRDSEGMFGIYSPFSREFNEIVSNKGGVISGIVEPVPHDAWARKTLDIGLVEEIIERIHERMPGWKVVTDGLAEAKIEREQYEAELKTPIPEVAAKLAPGFALFPYQNEAVRFLQETDGKALIGDEMGLGKQHPVDTKISTPWGWREIGDLVVGDPVTGSNGQPTGVKGVFPQGVKPSYRVWFSDGSSVEAGPDHLWTVAYRAGDRRWQELTLTTDHLRLRPVIEQTWPDGRTTQLDLSRTVLYLPMLAAPVEFADVELPIPAYTMGQLLGNGGCSCSTPQLTTNAHDWPEVRHSLLMADADIGEEHCYGGSTRVLIRGVAGVLRDLGLAVVSADQEIPEIYLRAHVDDRIDLLQALMDAAGGCSRRRNKLTFHSTSPRLAAGMVELVEGLGGIASIRPYDRTAEGKPIEYRVRLRLPMGIEPFRVARKLRRYRPGSHELPARRVDRVEYVRDVASVCIAVEASDRLYATEHYILTHNTLQALAYGAAGGKRMLVVVPKVVRRTWLQEASRFFPDYFEGATRELISADIRKGGQPDLSGVRLASVNYEALHKFLPAIKAAGFDTVVVDESHRMKSPKTKITKTLMGLRDSFKHRILLSGTAVKNKKDELTTQTEFVQPGLFTRDELTRGTIGGVWNKLRRSIYIARQKKDVLPDLPEKTTQIAEHSIPGMPSFPADIGEMSRARIEAAKAKAPVTIDFVKEILAASESKVLAFTESRATAELIADKLGSAAILHHGQLSDDKREDAKEEFQREGSPKRVFVSTRQSLAVGATLTAADKVVFNDIPWTAADLRQAEDRAHRVGQRNSVNVYWMTAEDGGWDNQACQILLRKYELNRKLNEGKQLTEAERKWMSEPVKLDDIRKELAGETVGPVGSADSGPGPSVAPDVVSEKEIDEISDRVEAARDEAAGFEPATKGVPGWDGMGEGDRYQALKRMAADRGWKVEKDRTEAGRYLVLNQYGANIGRGTLSHLHYQNFGGPPALDKPKPAPTPATKPDTAAAPGQKTPGPRRPPRQLSLFEKALQADRRRILVEAELRKGKVPENQLGFDFSKPKASGGPFIGPRGGKWKDAKHTIPWEEPKAAKPKAAKPTEAPPAPSEVGGLPFPVSPSDLPMREAQAAHEGSSFTPDARGSQEQQSYVSHMKGMWETWGAKAKSPEGREFLLGELKRYQAGYLSKLRAKLGADSRTMSPMIAGPSKFPTRRNQKRLDTAHKRLEDLMDFQASANKAISRRWQAFLTDKAGGPLAVAKKEIAQLERGQQLMKDANRVVRNKKLTDEQKVSKLQALGFDEKAATDLVHPPQRWMGQGFPSYKLTNNNATIKRKKERIAELERRAAAPEQQQTEGEGWSMSEDRDDDRLRLYFDAKPDEARRKALKGAGWRWSPRAGAWQRQLTDNARASAKQILDEHFGKSWDSQLALMRPRLTLRRPTQGLELVWLTEEVPDEIHTDQTRRAPGWSDQAALTKAKPPGTGWQAIPGSKHGGFRRRSSQAGTYGRWEYWYPQGGKQPGLFGEDKPRGESVGERAPTNAPQRIREQLDLFGQPKKEAWPSGGTVSVPSIPPRGAMRQQGLFKAANHKYIKRIPTGKERPKYRYIYRHPQRNRLTESSDLVPGSKFKVEHQGELGHFEVKAHDKEKGIVTLYHDESKRTVHIRERDLHRMIAAHHARNTQQVIRKQATQARLPGTAVKPKADPKPAPQLERASMADLGPHGYSQIEGFAADPEALEQQAAILAKRGREYALIQQPGGWVLASRETVTEGAKEAVGDHTAVYIRNKAGTGTEPLKAEWVVMEADDVIASHNPRDFTPRSEYPEGVQERRYEKIRAEQLKVERIAATLEPALVVNTTPTAIDGAPIVTEDGIVLGGNGRTMGLQRAYAQYPENGEKLKTYIAQHAKAFGVPPAQVAGMKQPILVRRVQSGKDKDKLTRLGRRMNESLTQGLDERSEQVAVSKFVTQDVVDTLNATIPPDARLDAFLKTEASREFVNAIRRAGIVDEYNEAQYLDQESKLLNGPGRARVTRVLAARVLPDPGMLDDLPEKLRENLAISTPFILMAEKAGWDMRPLIRTAAAADIDMRRRGLRRNAEDRTTYFQQAPHPKVDPDHPANKVREPEAMALLEAFQDKGHHVNVFSAGWKQIAIEADRQQKHHGAGDQPAQVGGGLFGGIADVLPPRVSKEQAILAAFGGKGSRARQAMAKALGTTVGELVKAEVPAKALRLYRDHAIRWEAENLVRGASLLGKVPNLLPKLKTFVSQQTQADSNFAAAVSQHPVTDEYLRGLLRVMIQANLGRLTKSLASVALWQNHANVR